MFIKTKQLHCTCKIPLKMHRMIMNASKGFVVDHINHNGLDNRKANLRLVTNAQNSYNRPCFKKKGSPSQYKGVYWSKRDNKWQVQISCKGKVKTIGQFKDEIQAAKAYDKAAKKYHGEFAYLNFSQTWRISYW